MLFRSPTTASWGRPVIRAKAALHMAIVPWLSQTATPSSIDSQMAWSCTSLPVLGAGRVAAGIGDDHSHGRQLVEEVGHRGWSLGMGTAATLARLSALPKLRRSACGNPYRSSACWGSAALVSCAWRAWL